jgi:hypothetical protein
MVNNVGGKERTLAEFRELLRAAGFILTTQAELPLGLHLLDAVTD